MQLQEHSFQNDVETGSTLRFQVGMIKPSETILHANLIGTRVVSSSVRSVELGVFEKD